MSKIEIRLNSHANVPVNSFAWDIPKRLSLAGAVAVAAAAAYLNFAKWRSANILFFGSRSWFFFSSFISILLDSMVPRVHAERAPSHTINAFLPHRTKVISIRPDTFVCRICVGFR